MIVRPFLAAVLATIVVGVAACGRPTPQKPTAGQTADSKEATDLAKASDRTTIEAAVASESGIRTAKAGPGIIRDEHEVQGLLTPVEGRHARVVARFPGPVRSVKVAIGDRVNTGQTLATIESNMSLSEYPVTAPFAGTVLARNVTVGDLANDQPLFEIADLSTLWVDLHLFGADAEHLRAGLPVEVERLSDGARISTVIDRILPGAATASQSTVARAVVSNTDGRWRTGSAVRARVSVSETSVAPVVPLTALQSMDGRDVVFVHLDDEYVVHRVKLGQRDSRHVEILEGLRSGDEIVVEQSYLIKANIEKSSVAESD
jgi:cobalt-zinc-cadmium efflux system membrane fusion protein